MTILLRSLRRCERGAARALDAALCAAFRRPSRAWLPVFAGEPWLRLLVGLLVGVALLTALSPGRAHAAAEPETQSLEQSVKAAYLFKFLGYVDWPPAAFPAATTPYVIGVAGADGVADELAELARGRLVNHRPVTVKILRYGEALTGVHMVFIGQREAHAEQWLQRAAQGAVLTVTEDEDGLQPGSVINLRTVQGHIRFDVSLGAADRRALKLSSRLLAVAFSVQPRF